MSQSRRKNAFHHRAVNVGQSEMPALEHVGETLVVDAELRQHRGLEVVNVHLVLNNIETKIVGLAVGEAWFRAAAGHPDCETIGMMIAAMLFLVINVALPVRRAAELAAPNHERVVEHAALFQILYERGRSLVGIPALFDELCRQVDVLIPARVHKLDESHIAFGKPTGH